MLQFPPLREARTQAKTGGGSSRRWWTPAPFCIQFSLCRVAQTDSTVPELRSRARQRLAVDNPQPWMRVRATGRTSTVGGVSNAADDDMAPAATSPLDFLASLLRLSPQDAERVRKPPGTRRHQPRARRRPARDRRLKGNASPLAHPKTVGALGENPLYEAGIQRPEARRPAAYRD